MTLQALSQFGIAAKWEDERTISVAKNQRYIARNFKIEGDYSHAAFFLIAGAIGGDVKVCGLDKDTLQGDRRIVSILKEMGADIEAESDFVRACGGNLRGVVVDASNIPDLVPALTVAACAAKGETRIINASRLRLKESDRLSAMAKELNRLGADIKETGDGLIIKGGRQLTGGECDAHGDHRVAMALTVASALCKDDIALMGSESIAKSAPHFYDEFCLLGGVAL